jgi:hypothetical protein
VSATVLCLFCGCAPDAHAPTCRVRLAQLAREAFGAEMLRAGSTVTAWRREHLGRERFRVGAWIAAGTEEPQS